MIVTMKFFEWIRATFGVYRILLLASQDVNALDEGVLLCLTEVYTGGMNALLNLLLLHSFQLPRLLRLRSRLLRNK